MIDVDGNEILDLYMQNGSLALGYNFTSLFSIFRETENLHTIINRPSLGVFPPEDWHHKLQNVLMANAPPGMQQVYTMMCGTCAVDSAMKAMFIAFRTNQRCGRSFSELERDTALFNMSPGAPRHQILSLMGGSHGHTMGGCSCSHFSYRTRAEFPTFDWPIGHIPKYILPLEDNKEENLKREKNALSQIRWCLDTAKDRNKPVVGIILETIQCDGDHNILGTNFVKGVQALAKEYSALFCIDEVDTGVGGSGAMWDHQHLNLSEPPDIVVFAKKMQFGGIYTKETLVHHPFRIFNTWMGDPGKLLVAEKTIQAIHACDLLENAKDVGFYFILKIQLISMAYPGIFFNIRGRGLLIAFSCCRTNVRDLIYFNLLQRGVLVGRCGKKTIYLRPALIVTKKEADIFACKLSGIVEDLTRTGF